MRYLLAVVLLAISWLFCMAFAKIIDLLNKNQDWYKAIHVEGEDET